LKRKDREEEERIQQKIRIEQEKMQREYEEDLRKQQEKVRKSKLHYIPQKIRLDYVSLTSSNFVIHTWNE